MSTKTIPFKQPVTSRPAENWVEGATAPSPSVRIETPTKRLTVDVPEDLHRRIKVACAMSDQQISDVVREILTKAYPAT